MNFHTVSRTPKGNTRVKATSAVASVAYALTTSLKDERLGETFNYAHGQKAKARHTIDLGLYFPGGVTTYQKERDIHGIYSKFWSKVELAEKRKDARTARTIIVALPVEMDLPEHQIVLEKFQSYLANTYGMASQAAIHYDHKHNPHAHIVTTTRTVTKDGELGQKIRILDSARSAHFEIKKIGEAWANINNEILIPKYHTSITHKSFEEQGIDKPKGEHLGPIEWRRREAELAEIEQQKIKLEQELNAIIRKEDNARRGTVKRAGEYSNSAIQGANRIADYQGKPRNISENDSRERRKISDLPSEPNKSENGKAGRQLATRSTADETTSQVRNRNAGNEKRTSSIPNESRKHDRENVRQAGTDYERRTPTAESGTTGSAGTIKRTGQEINPPGDSRENIILKLIQKLNSALTMLADYLELEQIKNPPKADIYAKLDRGLSDLQAKFDLNFIRGDGDGTREKPTKPSHREQQKSKKPAGPKV